MSKYPPNSIGRAMENYHLDAPPDPPKTAVARQPMPYLPDLIGEWESAYMAGRGISVGHRADTTEQAVQSWRASFPDAQSFCVPFAANRLGQLLVAVGWGKRAGTNDLVEPDVWFVRYSAKGPWAVLMSAGAKVHLP